jgi:hypothetical protein
MRSTCVAQAGKKVQKETSTLHVDTPPSSGCCCHSCSCCCCERKEKNDARARVTPSLRWLRRTGSGRYLTGGEHTSDYALPRTAHCTGGGGVGRTKKARGGSVSASLVESVTEKITGKKKEGASLSSVRSSHTQPWHTRSLARLAATRSTESTHAPVGGRGGVGTTKK